LELRAWGLGLGAWGLKSRVRDLVFRIYGLRNRAQG